MSTKLQIWRFWLVGIAATSIHVVAAIVLYSLLGISHLTANFIAFSLAWLFSYFGHYVWTFEGAGHHVSSVPKFLLVSLFGLALNQFIVWVVVDAAKLPFQLALACVVIIVPVLTFLLSKFWVFR